MWVLKEGVLESHWKSLKCEAGELQGYQNKWPQWGGEGGGGPNPPGMWLRQG